MSGRTVQLQEVCRIIQGGRLGLSGYDFVPEGFPAYGAGGMNGFLPTYEFDEPAVVLSAIGARCGKCFYAQGKWHSLANTQLIFPDLSRVDPKFLWYQLNDEHRWPRSGTGQPFIKPADVKSHRIFLPPLPEQRRIAAILDQADALRAKRRAALKKLDELTQSIFLDMFGDPATNPKGWPWYRLGDTSDFYAGSTLPEGEPFTGQDGGYFLLKVSDMNLPENEVYLKTCQQWSEFPGAAACTCPEGSIVIPKRGGAIGTNKKRITTRPAVLDPNLMAIVPRRGQVELQFLYAWLLRLDLVSMTSGSSVPQINKRDLEPLRIAVPPLDLQQEFACRLVEVEKIVGRQQAAARQI